MDNKIEQSLENLEIEIKYLLAEAKINQIRKKIKDNFVHKMYEKTIMYDNKEGFMDKKDARLRIRIIGENENEISKVKVSYKQRLKGVDEDGVDTQKEIEFHTDGKYYNNIELTFDEMGYQKNHKLWKV